MEDKPGVASDVLEVDEEIPLNCRLVVLTVVVCKLPEKIKRKGIGEYKG